MLHENDSQAFGTLVSRYTSQVYRASLRLLKDEDNAAEVSQMAFIQAYRQLASWRGENFGAWVTIIANHIGLRMLEKEKRRQTVSLDATDEEDNPTEIPDRPDEGYDAEREQRLQSLEQAVSELPEADRQIIQWHYYESMPLQAIADRLGQTENNIGVRIFRIRERLKAKLKGER